MVNFSAKSRIHIAGNFSSILFLSVFFLIASSEKGFSQDIHGFQQKEFIDDRIIQSILDKGMIIMVDESGTGRLKPATVGMIIDASHERIWEVMTNYEASPKMFPEIKKAEVIEKENNSSKVYFKIALAKLGVVNICTHCTLKMTHYKPNKIVLSWVDGWVRDVNGSWVLVPIDAGKRTVVFYTLSADYSRVLPGAKLILARRPEADTAINIGVNIVLAKAIKAEAEKVR